MILADGGAVVPKALTSIELQYGAFALCLALIVLIAWLVVQFMRELKATREVTQKITDHCSGVQCKAQEHIAGNFDKIETCINHNSIVIGRCTGALDRVEKQLDKRIQGEGI